MPDRILNVDFDGAGYDPDTTITTVLVDDVKTYALFYRVTANAGSLQTREPVRVLLSELSQASQDGITAAYVEGYNIAKAKTAAKDFK